MRRVRPIILLLASALAAIALASCGSSSSGPLATGLSYFSPDSPFVLSIQTDPKSAAVKDAQGLLHRIPLVTFGESALIARLQQLGINYDADIRPLFGNPLLAGFAGSAIGGSARPAFLVVWVTNDAGALSTLVKKLHLQPGGSHDGATLYHASSATFAVSGATVIAGPSAEVVNRALDRHANGGGMASSQYNKLVSGLPSNALIQAAGNLAGVITARAPNARRVPWVAALRGYAASISVSSTGLSFRFRFDTSAASVTTSELPIATGTTPPNLDTTLPIAFGVRDPAQLFRFVQSAEQAASPAKYQNFLRRQERLRRRTGTDVNSLLRLVNGDLLIASDIQTTIGKAQVSDPAAARDKLAKLATDPKSVFMGATSVTRTPGGFYLYHEPRHTITVGVVGSHLVVGKATPARLRAFASAPTAPAAGAQGAAAFRIALPALLRLALRSAPTSSSSTSKIIQTLFRSLGDITGWLEASPRAVTGSATLALK